MAKISISQCFEQLRSRQECALIPFITAGDPDLATTVEALKLLDRSGADIIELGVPYSDPLADGPTIQAAATRALAKGVRLDDVLELVSKVTPELKAPLILFTYYNPILYRGIDTFLQQIAQAGVSGLVVPDLPLEEAEGLIILATKYGIEVIMLIAPTSSPARMAAIAQVSQGFIYLVSVTGVTGTRTALATKIPELLQEIRTTTTKPIGVGFGISDPEQAKQVKAWGADAVIVGSAMVKRLAGVEPKEGLAAIEEFCKTLKQAINSKQ